VGREFRTLRPFTREVIEMAEFFSGASRGLQDRFDTRRLADKVERLVHDFISADDRAFIERMDMFFLATVDADGHANCSYKGGEPGFVRVIDDRTLAFPNYDGNGMYLSMGNVVETGEVGMLFVDFENQWRMRLNGVATVDVDDPLKSEWPEAQFVVRVAAREVFPNCPRYVHHYSLVERSRFAPKEGCKTPVPAWKKSEWAQDALSANDPARGEDREVIG
jgi:predicted pyridoxine 5'-phosphate oxidase superfamily flavin-nucleotide-binding protein